MADEKILRIIRDYIALLNHEGFLVDKAYLYGSQVSGNTHIDSDIDVMLILDKFDESDLKRKSHAWLLTRKIDSRIEPCLISRHRFSTDKISPILDIVRTEGQEILLEI